MSSQSNRGDAKKRTFSETLPPCSQWVVCVRESSGISHGSIKFRRFAFEEGLYQDVLGNFENRVEIRSSDRPDGPPVASLPLGMLTGCSAFFDDMLSCKDMKEGMTNIITIPTNAENTEALVSLMVREHATGMRFDAAEVWILLMTYNMRDLTLWIQEECTKGENAVAALNFACSVASPETICPYLKDVALKELMKSRAFEFPQGSLEGLCRDAVGRLLDLYSVAETKDAIEKFSFIERWVKDNGADPTAAFSLLDDYWMDYLPLEFLMGPVRSSKIVPEKVQVVVGDTDVRLEACLFADARPFVDNVKQVMRDACDVRVQYMDMQTENMIVLNVLSRLEEMEYLRILK